MDSLDKESCGSCYQTNGESRDERRRKQVYQTRETAPALEVIDSTMRVIKK